MLLRRISAALLSSAIVGIPVTAGALEEFLARSGFYGPKVQLRYAKPTFRWEVWADKGQVAAVEMTVNGEAVDARYDSAKHAVCFTPSVALNPGVHKVHCKVTFSDQSSRYAFTKDWEATVVPSALTVLPNPSPRQEMALGAANNIRSGLGLPAFTGDDRLNAAATAHSVYMAENNAKGHREKLGNVGFTGTESSARLEAFGWGGSSWEELAYGFSDVTEAVRNIYDAPYHRVPFMQPGTLQFGFGSADQKSTVEIEGSRDNGVIFSPADGQASVPVSWASKEEPNPLDIHPEVQQPTGYPIVLADFELGKAQLQLTAAHIWNSAGVELKSVLNSPENDSHLTNAVVLIPVSPLAPGSVYKVSVSAVGPGGSAFERIWTFKTAG